MIVNQQLTTLKPSKFLKSLTKTMLGGFYGTF